MKFRMGRLLKISLSLNLIFLQTGVQTWPLASPIVHAQEAPSNQPLNLTDYIETALGTKWTFEINPTEVDGLGEKQTVEYTVSRANPHSAEKIQEVVEVTPKNIRIRKALLDPHERKKASRKKEAA